MEDCWKKDSDERIRASQIVEYLATRPTLLVPCLEDPPQMDLSNQMNQEIDMSDMPEFKRTSTNRVRDYFELERQYSIRGLFG